jgi:hypothetical protein
MVQITAGPKAGPPAYCAIVGHGRLRRSKTKKGSARAAREVEGKRAFVADLASGAKISWEMDAEDSQWGCYQICITRRVRRVSPCGLERAQMSVYDGNLCIN